MAMNLIKQPYDLIKVPYEWLPDRLIRKIGVDGRWLFEDFITNNLICDYETFYIDTDGQVIRERVVHSVELVDWIPKLKRTCVMEKLVNKGSSKPTTIKARTFHDNHWIEMEFLNGIVKEIKYTEGV